MKINLLKKENQIISVWAGGTTTQLAIYPESASYHLRDFIFRISSAKVEAETSVFTKLPGVSRILMVLEGELQLEHKGRYTTNLKKFDSDSFEGSWDTTSQGKVNDFNLMTREGAKGTLQSKILQSGESFSETLFVNSSFVGFYLLCGSIQLSHLSKTYSLHKNDFILLSKDGGSEEIKITAAEYCEMLVPLITI